MKLFKMMTVMIMLGFVLIACDETTDPVDDTPRPNAPSNAQATSISSTSIKVKWDASTSETDPLFVGYRVYVSPGGFQPMDVTKEQNPIVIDGLTEDGTTYTVQIEAVFSNGEVSVNAATVQWAPASRFTEDYYEDPIQLYGSSSQWGSGLDMYNTEDAAPKTLKVADGDKWNLGLYTKNNEIIFGSASEFISGDRTYSFASDPMVTEIADVIVASSFDEIYDSQALNTKNFSAKLIDLSQYQSDIIMIVREKHADGTYNYAKVLVKRDTGGWLQGSGNDVYVEVEISYQMDTGTPYAL